jgi:hypothetical protein
VAKPKRVGSDWLRLLGGLGAGRARYLARLLKVLIEGLRRR